MKFFEDLTEEECMKNYGFSKEDMNLLYNNGKSLMIKEDLEDLE